MSKSPHAVIDGLHTQLADQRARLEELENSYVPHLPADTDTWLVDHVDSTLEHPLPPGSRVKLFYGPAANQFLTVQATDQGLRISAEFGWLSITPNSPNSAVVTGSVR